MQDLLQKEIECQFFKPSPSALPLNFSNVTLIPTSPKECTWKWIQDGVNSWDGAFNISLHQTPEPSLNMSDRNQGLKSVNSTEQDVMMALTCWLPSSREEDAGDNTANKGYSQLMQKVLRRQSMTGDEQNVATLPGVTFAAPFILRKSLETNRTQLHPSVTVIHLNTSIAIVAAMVSLALFVVVVVIGYRCYKRRYDKR